MHDKMNLIEIGDTPITLKLEKNHKVQDHL